LKASLKQGRKKERGIKSKSKRKPGRPSSGKKCPRCGKVGSPQLKAVKNRKDGGEYKYVYYAHPTGPHTVRWCYIGGKSLSSLRSQKQKQKLRVRKT
jgi:hypothetical protein